GPAALLRSAPLCTAWTSGLLIHTTHHTRTHTHTHGWALRGRREDQRTPTSLKTHCDFHLSLSLSFGLLSNFPSQLIPHFYFQLTRMALSRVRTSANGKSSCLTTLAKVKGSFVSQIYSKM